MSDHAGILTGLSAFERCADAGSVAVGLGGLKEDMLTVAVACIGHGAQASSLARAVLFGDRAEMGHELPGVAEAAEFVDLGS